MKKLLLGLFAAGMIFTACEKDEIDSLNADLVKTQRDLVITKAALEATIAEVAANLQDAKDELAAADAANTALIAELEASVEAYVAQFTQLLIAKEAEFLALLDAEAKARAAGDNSLTEGLLSLDAKVDGYVAEFTAILIEKEALYLSLLSDNAVASTQYTDAEIDSLKVYVDNGIKLLQDEIKSEVDMLTASIADVEDASIVGVAINGITATIEFGDGSTRTLDLGHLNEYVRDFDYNSETNVLSWKFFYGQDEHEEYSINLSELQDQINDNSDDIAANDEKFLL